MVKAVSIILIGEDPNAHGMFDTYTPIERPRMAEIPTSTARSAYQALSMGLHPKITFRLAIAEDYQDERQLLYDGVRYQITDTVLNGDGIDLICERWTGDV